MRNNSDVGQCPLCEKRLFPYKSYGPSEYVCKDGITLVGCGQGPGTHQFEAVIDKEGFATELLLIGGYPYAHQGLNTNLKYILIDGKWNKTSLQNEKIKKMFLK